MKTLFLHIGMPKTGTSAVQRFFADNRELLSEEGFLYPDFGLRYEGIGVNRNAHWLHKQGYNEDEAQECFEKLRTWSEQYDRILISDEGIWNQNFHDQNFWEEGFFPWLKSRLEEIGMELHVIVFLRRQDELFYSYWSQMVKERSTETFEACLQKRETPFWKNRLDLEQNLREVENTVGLDHMTVRVYQPARYKEDSHILIRDFLDAAGVKDDKEWKVLDRRVNISLTDVPLEVCRRMNQDPSIQVQKLFAYGMLKKVQQEREEAGKDLRRPVFTVEERSELLRPYAEGNKRVAERYLKPEEAELLSVSHVSGADKKPPEISEEEICEVYNRLLFLQEEEIQKRKESISELKSANAALKKDKAALKSEKAALKKDLEKAQRSLTERIARRFRKKR